MLSSVIIITVFVQGNTLHIIPNCLLCRAFFLIQLLEGIFFEFFFIDSSETTSMSRYIHHISGFNWDNTGLFPRIQNALSHAFQQYCMLT
jgi:hypothetical protein